VILLTGHETRRWRIVGVVERVGRDGPAGVAALFEAERPAMLRLAVLLVDSRALAEEIVQDAFESVTARWDDLERPGAYLRTSVVNGCRMALRRRSTARRLDPPRAAPAVDAPTELVELHEALRRLPGRQRLVLVLRYLHDLPDAEIAELAGCRPATVRSAAARGLRALRRDLS
jgi:RNA polymerase sigma factor (sigma-70 family)